jgi:hypothetical protein
MTFCSQQENLPEGYALYKRLSFLTKTYHRLQGLRLMPIWLIGVLHPLGVHLPNRRPFFIQDYAIIGFVIFFPLWFWLSGKWYRKHYGSVETGSPLLWLTMIPGSIAVMYVYYSALVLDDKNPLVSFSALFWVCFITVILLALPNDRVRSVYYGVAAGCMFLVSLVPMTGWISASNLMYSHQRNVYNSWGFFTLNVLMLIGSLLDHFLLVHRLSQSRGNLHVL